MPITRSAIYQSLPGVSNKDKGTKRNADGRAVLGEITNKARSNILRNKQKVLTSRNQNLKSKPKLADKPKPKEEPIEYGTFEGHTDFMIVPLKTWQYETRDSLKKQNKFHDQEEKSKNNHLESPDFSLGIFEYMKWREERYEMLPYFETKIQTGFNYTDRKTLVDWMVEFQEIQETTHETLYLAVRLCDYFFGRQQVPREKLQLYAFTSFLIASKFEERWPPTFDDMIYLSEDSYTKEDFIAAELQMLKAVDFDLNIPISYRYLRRYSKCVGMDMKSLTVSRFYLELTLQEYEFVAEKQSLLAAACLWLSLYTLGYDSEKRQVTKRNFRGSYWSALLSFYTGYQEWEVVKLAKRVAKCVRIAQSECEDLSLDEDQNIVDGEGFCTVVYKKYASTTFFEVARMELLSEADVIFHDNRTETMRVDFECQQEPNVKRRSSGCVTKMQAMKLRSSVSPKP